jgi:hypothetical protein
VNGIAKAFGSTGGRDDAVPDAPRRAPKCGPCATCEVQMGFKRNGKCGLEASRSQHGARLEPALKVSTIHRVARRLHRPGRRMRWSLWGEAPSSWLLNRSSPLSAGFPAPVAHLRVGFVRVLVVILQDAIDGGDRFCGIAEGGQMFLDVVEGRCDFSSEWSRSRKAEALRQVPKTEDRETLAATSPNRSALPAPTPETTRRAEDAVRSARCPNGHRRNEAVAEPVPERSH